MKVKRLEGTLKVETEGVFNYNGVGKLSQRRAENVLGRRFDEIIDFNQKEQKFKNGDNHQMAKTLRDGRDYTSSNCLSHYLFKDIITRQKAGDRDDWDKIMGSPLGFLRGGGYLEKGKNFARSKTLFVGHAVSDKKELVFENRSSSAAKKSDEGDKNKTTFFTRETAGKRIQTASVDLDIQNMSVFLLDPVDAQSMHTHPTMIKATLERIKEYFLKQDPEMCVKNINDESMVQINSGTAYQAMGFVLTPEQSLILIKEAVRRLERLFAVNSHGKIKAKELKLVDQNGVAVDVNELKASDLDIVYEQVPRPKPVKKEDKPEAKPEAKDGDKGEKKAKAPRKKAQTKKTQKAA